MTRGAGRPEKRQRASGQCRLGGLGDPVKLQIQLGVLVDLTQFGQLAFEFCDQPAQPNNFETECLFIGTADISQQGACHVATFQSPV